MSNDQQRRLLADHVVLLLEALHVALLRQNLADQAVVTEMHTTQTLRTSTAATMSSQDSGYVPTIRTNLLMQDCTIVVQGLLFLLPSSTAPTSSTSAAGMLPQQPPDPWCRHAHRYDALNLKMYTQALAFHMYN